MTSADYRDADSENEPSVMGGKQHPSVGATWIVLERARQMTEEGWTPEHDDDHDTWELGIAARCYLTAGLSEWGSDAPAPWTWPWDKSWWKPSDDPIRNLTKAGALIAAEIDRLQRRRNG